MKSRLILVFLVIGGLVKGGIYAQEKETKFDAAVAPIAYLGEVSAVKRQIVYNKFQEKNLLCSLHRLQNKPQKKI